MKLTLATCSKQYFRVNTICGSRETDALSASASGTVRLTTLQQGFAQFEPCFIVEGLTTSALLLSLDHSLGRHEQSVRGVGF